MPPQDQNNNPDNQFTSPAPDTNQAPVAAPTPTSTPPPPEPVPPPPPVTPQPATPPPPPVQPPSPPPTRPNDPVPPPPPSIQPEEQGPHSNLTLLLIGILAIIILAVGAWWYWQSQMGLKPVLESEVTEEVPQQPAIAPDPTANWQTYGNEEYGFEFKYPEEWDICPDASPDFPWGLPVSYTDTMICLYHRNFEPVPFDPGETEIPDMETLAEMFWVRFGIGNENSGEIKAFPDLETYRTFRYEPEDDKREVLLGESFNTLEICYEDLTDLRCVIPIYRESNNFVVNYAISTIDEDLRGDLKSGLITDVLSTFKFVE